MTQSHSGVQKKFIGAVIFLNYTPDGLGCSSSSPNINRPVRVSFCFFMPPLLLRHDAFAAPGSPYADG